MAVTNKLFAEHVKYLACPKCNGYGYFLTTAGEHKDCPHCSMKNSLGFVVENNLLYWDKKINRLSILQEKVQYYFKKIIQVFLGIIGLFGFGCLVYFFIINISSKTFIEILASKSIYLLAFFISLIADLFLIYQIDLENKKKKVIKKRYPGDDIKTSSEMFEWSEVFNNKNFKKINVVGYFNKEAVNIINKAFIIAQKNNQPEVNAIDLLGATCENPKVQLVLARLGINFKVFIEKISRVLRQSSQAKVFNIEFGLSAKKAFLAAYYEAYYDHLEQISSIELFLGLIMTDKTIQDIFDDLAVPYEKINNAADWVHLDEQLRKWAMHYNRVAKNKPKNHMNRAMTARPTKLLDSLSQDYTLQARYGAFFPLITRKKEVGEAFRVLKEGRGNVMLVGDPGVGKTTIIEGIAQMMTSEDVPHKLQDKRLVVLDPGVLIAGAAGIGGIEDRMNKIIHEVVATGNVILVIEDIHNLLGAKSTGSGSDVAEILMNYLSQGYLQVIGTSTTEEFKKYIQNKETFLRRFQVVKIKEMTQPDAIKVLEARSGFIEAKQHVFFSYDSLESCVTLTDRYIKDRHLPSKAIDLAEEAAILCREKRGENSIITKEEVAAVLSEKTNVEVGSITTSEAQKLLNFESIMHESIVGQHEAIEAISKAMRRSREELRDTKRPIASFLFLGPTGVGKTETAKTIAKVYFGNENNMIRLDMSEYQEKSSLIKMIGDPNTKGYLTEAVRANPFSVVLLDELEKAHPDILNLFLQVIDDGRLTDGYGRTIDFTNTIIIATSNAATASIQAGFSQGMQLSEIYEGLMQDVLEKYFRVEFLNRFDRIVIFSPLQPNEIVEITKLLLNKLQKLLEDKGIVFQYTEVAAADLAKKGYSPKFGARPLRRLIQDTVDDALAKLMLEQQLTRRDVVILHEGGQLEINKAKII